MRTQVIRELEIKKKKDLYEAMNTIESLREENQELKRKLEAAKCRSRNLECEATSIKMKIQTFVEKSTHDDMLINEQRVNSNMYFLII